jgi:PhnB protein
MELNPYLHFNGNCQEAFTFYEKVLGAKKLMMMTYGEAPQQPGQSPAMAKKIIHARIQLGNSLLMGSDAPPERFHKPQGFTVNVGCDKPEEADRIFKGLSDGGSIVMPIAKTFWAERFGMVIDKFGIPWMVNCETRNS